MPALPMSYPGEAIARGAAECLRLMRHDVAAVPFVSGWHSRATEFKRDRVLYGRCRRCRVMLQVPAEIDERVAVDSAHIATVEFIQLETWRNMLAMRIPDT